MLQATHAWGKWETLGPIDKFARTWPHPLRHTGAGRYPRFQRTSVGQVDSGLRRNDGAAVSRTSEPGLSRNLEPLQGRAVDLDAEAGGVGDVDPSAAVLDRLLQHRHADRVLGAVEFEQRLDRI